MRQPPKVVLTFALFIILVAGIAGLFFSNPAVALDDRTTFEITKEKISRIANCYVLAQFKSTGTEKERAAEVVKYERLLDSFSTAYNVYKVQHTAYSYGYLYGYTNKHPDTLELSKKLVLSANHLFKTFCTSRIPGHKKV